MVELHNEEDIVELHAPNEDEFFHTDDEMPTLEDERMDIQVHRQQDAQNLEEGDIPDRLSPTIKKKKIQLLHRD